MLARDMEMFIEHCENKGLAKKTIGSYEQTLRLFMQYMDEQGILLTEKITHAVIRDYAKEPSSFKEAEPVINNNSIRSGSLIRKNTGNSAADALRFTQYCATKVRRPYFFFFWGRGMPWSRAFSTNAL